MSIADVRFEGGIFFCREIGRIDADDAERWAQYAQAYAQHANGPFIALVDAREAEYITAAARSIFAEASSTPNLYAAAVVVGNFLVEQHSRLVNMMALEKHTQIFDTMAEAYTYAKAQLAEARAQQTGV